MRAEHYISSARKHIAQHGVSPFQKGLFSKKKEPHRGIVIISHYPYKVKHFLKIFLELFIYYYILLVICAAFVYFKGAVNLFKKHNAEKPVRKGHFGKRYSPFGFFFYAFVQAVRAAYYKRERGT